MVDMQRSKLNIYWGNYKWIRDKNGYIRQHERLTKGHRKWIDYRNPPVADSACLRQNHPDADLRCEYTDSIISQLITSNLNCLGSPPNCFITCGGTASGKTSSVDSFLKLKMDRFSYLRIDYDSLKISLPEYDHMRSLKIKNASQYVHVESAKMAGKLFKTAIKQNLNIIFEKTLADANQTIEEIGKLRKKQYKIFVIATHVKESIGQERALKRYGLMGRHVDPSEISKIYQGVPKSLLDIRDLVDGLVLYDNNGDSLKMILERSGSSVQIVDSVLYGDYLKTVGIDLKLD
jgi:predicted ABC-type ATPase